MEHLRKHYTKEEKQKIKILLDKIKQTIYTDGRYIYFDMKLKLVARAEKKNGCYVKFTKICQRRYRKKSK